MLAIFGIAETGEQAAQAGDGEGDHHARAGISGGGVAGEHEDAGADDGADAQRDQMQRAQRPLQVAFVVRIFRNSAMQFPRLLRHCGRARALRLAPIDQAPDAGLADFAVFQFAGGGDRIVASRVEAGLGEIVAAGIAQQDVAPARIVSQAISRSASGRS